MNEDKQSPEDVFDELRTALLNWYPFKRSERVFLCAEKAGVFRKLLDPYFETVETSRSFSFGSDEYDYVILLDVLEKHAEEAGKILDQVNAHLKPGGRLLLGFRNRFGIKYLCGGLDPYVLSPYEAIASGGNVGGLHIFAKEEMRSLLNGAGFSQVRWYYPMPDSGFPQAVYTDEYLPHDSIRDRVFPYDPYNSPFLLPEADLYDDMVREGTLPAAANYFLAECSRKEISDRHVIYAALSTDRGPEHGFATILYSDGTACKKVLDPKGIPFLQKQYENLETLRRRGILTVDQKLEDDRIVMPLIREEASLTALCRAFHHDPDAVLKCLELFWKDILASSDPGALSDEQSMTEWGIGSAGMGPILKMAYIDMIPYNAFLSEGRARFYDQEFTVENCPAKYVLFRALRYTWLHIREAESLFPLEAAKEHFGLTELWDAFQKREDRFVAENRNYKKLYRLYRWARIDRAEMIFRRKELKREADWERQNAAPLLDVHEVHSRLLKKLDQVCRSNGLQYMVIHGTLLGTVVHQGFINWDDDVDIMMPRKDYDRLLARASELFPAPYFLQTPANNYGCYYGGYVKLRYNGTEALEPQNSRKSPLNCHQGIWIDILPLDDCPAPGNQLDALTRRLRFVQRLIYAKAYSMKEKYPRDVDPVSRIFYWFLSRFVRRKHLIAAFDRICREQTETGYKGILACYYGKRKNKNVWPADYFRSYWDMPCDNVMVPVPADWEKILRQRYGDSFWDVPPVEQRKRHWHIHFSPNLGSIDDGE